MMNFSRGEKLKRWIEKDQNEYKKTNNDFTEEVFLSLCTEDFKVTNLNDNSVIGQGFEYIKKVNEYEKDLLFTVKQIITAGNFEIVNYEVVNAKKEKGSGTIIYRFRNERVCEMLLLDHD